MRTSIVVAAILSGTVGACGSAKQSPPRAAPPPPTLAETPDAWATKSPTRSVVNISEDIRRACGITDADAHFAFDSAQLTSRDYPTLDRLVQCFTSGPLAKREMRLVGHADPRGDEEYNLTLGGRRADGVKVFLVGRGLSGARARTTSRGEMEAKGTNEATWAEDRRVDVLLAN